MIVLGDVAYLPRGVRTHRDAVRGADVLLGPERVLMLDQVGHAILSRLDGAATVGAVVAELAEVFAAPADVIGPDVTEYLQDLVQKGFVHVRAA